MRTCIERLAEQLAAERASWSADITLGDLATKYGESVDRIQDALDVVKILSGERTYV